MRVISGAEEQEQEQEDEVHYATVMRRFSKFDALRKLIIKRFPGLPKLPKKGFRRHGGVGELALAEYTEQERMIGRQSSRSTADQQAAASDPRMGGLNIFLTAVIETDGASDDEHVQQFLGVSELDRMTSIASAGAGGGDGGDEHEGMQGMIGEAGGQSQSSKVLWGKAHGVVTVGKMGSSMASMAGTGSADLGGNGNHDPRGSFGHLGGAGSMGMGMSGGSMALGGGVSGNMFESGVSAKRSGSYKPREERNIGQHAVHSVAKKAGRGIEVVGVKHRNAPPTVPRRVRDMLGVDESALGTNGTFRSQPSLIRSSIAGGGAGHGGGLSAFDTQSEVVKVVDLWSCYVKLHSNAEGHFTTFMLYAVYWVLLMMTFFDGPNSSWSLSQSEAIDDLLFDEEFSDANYKKNWHEIMTQEELFTWIEGPLTNALFTEDAQNASLLGGTTHLVGNVQFRQVRVNATACPQFPDSFMETQSEKIPPGATCSSAWQADESGPHIFGNYTDSWREHYQPLEGSRSFVKEPSGSMIPWVQGKYDYGKGGYSVLMPRQYGQWVEKVEQMRADFVDQHTRALAVTLVLYNGNSFRFSEKHTADADVDPLHADWHDPIVSDQMLFVQAVLEMDPGGHYEKTTRVLAMRPMRQVSDPSFSDDSSSLDLARPFGHRMLWREDGFAKAWCVLAMLLFLVEARKLLWVEGPKSFLIISSSAAWNKFEVWVWFLLFLTLWASMQMQEQSDVALKQLAAVETRIMGRWTHDTVIAADGNALTGDHLIDEVAELRDAEIFLRRCTAWLLFFSTLKVMKFMNLSERLSFLWRVLGHAKLELMAFLGIFLVLLSSFALLATVMMGYHARELHNVSYCSIISGLFNKKMHNLPLI